MRRSTQLSLPAQIHMIIRKSFFLLLFSLITVTFAKKETNQQAWQMLIDNNPLEAKEIFRTNSSSEDTKVAGEAYRGLAYISKFLGQNDSATIFLFKSFLADKDTLSLNAAWINILPFSNGWSGHFMDDGYSVTRRVIRNPNLLYAGNFYSLLIDRYVNDGSMRKARKLAKSMGVVRSFRMIGPFDNISGSGYKKQYPPELKLDFSKMYQGKDGAQATWFPFYNENPNGWLFTEYNYSSYNSTLYYYSTIRSEKEQWVYLAFGASGAFKVFLNDNLVLADSIFRNTGTDMFIQKTRLFAGDNALLIKICHENKSSNFLIRFVNEKGLVMPGISYSGDPPTFTRDTIVFKEKTNCPYTDTVRNRLSGRLAKNPRDNEAAILLMDFYNASEITDPGQTLARTFVGYYPNSSFWHGLYSESLQRSNKITDAQTELSTAFRLCNLNFSAWHDELQVLANSAGSREIMDFLDKSPELFQHTAPALLYKLGHYMQSNNETESRSILQDLLTFQANNDVIVNFLAQAFIESGNTRKAETVLKNFLKYQESSTDIYSALAGMYLKMGQMKKTVKTYKKALRYSPVSPGFYYYLAKLAFQYNDYASAEEYIEKAIAQAPASSQILSMKGSILQAQGKKDDAKKTLKKAIAYNYHDFDAWDQLLPLEDKPEITSLTKNPSTHELTAAAKAWEDRDNENGSILAFVKDIFLYPSRCSRERNFLMVHLPTQNAIDLWKEYTIDYNSYYQTITITRAYSKSAAGKETPADVENTMVVFKTLQPGDDIVLEWAVENYYTQDMAKQIWGDHEFSLPFPVFQTELRLVAPQNDTIPYSIRGKAVAVATKQEGGFRVTTFSRGPYKNPPQESFALIDPPEKDRVYYSTVTRWEQIAHWYTNVTENKVEQTYELKRLVDSLVSGVTLPKEKVRRIHDYIVRSIRYSFVPFRQSAWIPQTASEVLATKIGDCKDMASLAKSLFDYAGMESYLVLVNTRDRNSVYPSYIGPNFNHCIVSSVIDGALYFSDMTAVNLSVNTLPAMDQGALALVVKTGNDSLIHLPVDAPERRTIQRTVLSSVNNSGTLSRRIATIKSGIFAGEMRDSYRFQSPAEQKKGLKQTLVKNFPDLTVDSLAFVKLDSLSDTLAYVYSYTVKNGVQFSGATAILSLDITDKLTGLSYPSEENRTYPIDMMLTWFAVGTYSFTETLTIPERWKLITPPQKVSLSGAWGSYNLSIEQKGTKLICKRDAAFNFREPINATDSGQLRAVLAKIAQADNIQLVFNTR